MNKLKDILFVSVDGLGDYFSDFNSNSLKRIEKVKEIKKQLESQNLKVILMNPLADADIKIPKLLLSCDFETEYIDYSIFLLQNLYDYIKDKSFSHVIIFQYDGYPINLEAWDDDFLNYDYLGYIEFEKNNIGESIDYNTNLFSLKNNLNGFSINGGFSLRSRSLVERCSKISIDDFKKLYEYKKCTNEDLILLDYIDFNKMPKTSDIFKKFVDSKKETKSFGFHKNN